MVNLESGTSRSRAVVGHEGKYNKLVTNGLCSFEKLMKQTVA